MTAVSPADPASDPELTTPTSEAALEPAPLPTWQDIKEADPELGARLRANRHDYDGLVEYAKRTFGARVISVRPATRDDRRRAGLS